MLDIIDRAEFWLGAALLAIITGLVFVAAVMRFTGHPLIWSVDMAQLLFIWLCFVGAARAMRQHAHLGVDLLVARLPRRGRLGLELALAAVVLVFLGMLAWQGWKLTLMNTARIFGDSGLPYWLVTVAVPVGSVHLAICVIANALRALRDPAGERLVFARTDNGPPAPAQPEAQTAWD